MKMIVEMSGAIVLAAILKDKRFENKKVCAIISGGNMDITPYFNNLKSKMWLTNWLKKSIRYSSP